MSLKLTTLLPAALLLASTATISYAEIVTYQISATIVDVSDPNNVLAGNMGVGNTITGSYSFDNTVPDFDPSNEYSYYDFTNSAVSGFDLIVNGESLKTAPSTPGFMHQIYISNTLQDSFHIGSWGNQPLSNGAQVHDINIDLYDDTGTALNSDTLSNTPPNPSAFTYRDMYIGGSDANNSSYYSVMAKVDSITVSGGGNPTPDLAAMLVDATVRDIWDPANALNGAVTIGSSLSGTYTYNITTPDSAPGADYGRYSHQPNSGSFGFDITTGGLNFKTDPSQVEMIVELYNGIPNPDTYMVYSYGNNIPLPSGAQVLDIGMYLHDDQGTMFSSDAIASNPPSISSSSGMYDLFIYGMHSNGIDSFHITLTVNSLNPSMPEQNSMVTISPASGKFDSHQRFDLAFIFEPNIAQLLNLGAKLNGVDISTSLFICTIGAPNSQNRQTLVCPDFSYVLDKGNNVIDFSIELIDGTQLTESITWEVIGF